LCVRLRIQPRDPFTGQYQHGKLYHGCRVARVPDELKQLSIPAESIITMVNGAQVTDAATMLATVREQLLHMGHPRRMFVDYLFRGAPHAVEYRLMGCGWAVPRARLPTWRTRRTAPT
jgi:sulfur carrier protein ThiS